MSNVGGISYFSLMPRLADHCLFLSWRAGVHIVIRELLVRLGRERVPCQLRQASVRGLRVSRALRDDGQPDRRAHCSAAAPAPADRPAEGRGGVEEAARLGRQGNDGRRVPAELQAS